MVYDMVLNIGLDLFLIVQENWSMFCVFISGCVYGCGWHGDVARHWERCQPSCYRAMFLHDWAVTIWFLLYHV